MENYFLKCFRSTFERVKAYQIYLNEYNIDPTAIKALQEFKTLPQKDKKSYNLKFPLTSLFPNGKIPSMIHTSSGSAGKPTLWFRGEKQYEVGEKSYKDIFTNIFGINKDDKTLVIICFAMGSWIAGTYTLMSCHEISRKGYQISTFPAGMDPLSICAVLRESNSFFKNVILIGYPFFLDVILEEIFKQKIEIPKNLYVVTSGDKFSEAWRKNILEKISQPIEQSKRIINIYGTSDAGILGYETPLSISIRQHALLNPTLYKSIFGNSDPSVQPTLVQYDPETVFFEEENGEIVLTCDLDCPLVRYNIHDRGKVISFSEMKELLASLEIKNLIEEISKTSWKNPFLVIDTRTDVSVIFEAIKIFPEQIKAGISDSKVSAYFSGSFLAYAKQDAQGKNRLFFDIELAKDLDGFTDEMKEKTLDCIVSHLRDSNSEYRDKMLKSSSAFLAVPVLTFYPYGSELFKNVVEKDKETTTVISLIGKKTKILNKIT